MIKTYIQKSLSRSAFAAKAPAKCWLGDYFLLEMSIHEGLYMAMLNFRDGSLNSSSISGIRQSDFLFGNPAR